MNLVSKPSLQRIGWDEARDALHVTSWSKTIAIVRVMEVHRETVVVTDGERVSTVRIHPRLRHTQQSERVELAVGDWVGAEEGWIVELAAHRAQLVRKDGSGVRHVIVSNIDVAFVVMGLDGDFNLRRVERFLTIVKLASREHAVTPVIVLTKADLCAEAADRLALVQTRVGAHVAVIALDGRALDAGDMLRQWVPPGVTAVLIGSSGAGKSTLTNAILGATKQDTGATRAGDDRGQHTTTSRSLHLVPDGGCIIDTPGVRTLAPDIEAAGLLGVFDDIAQHAPQCKFRNCTHTVEPGCEVRAHVEADRVDNYQKMLRDAKRDGMTPLERQAQHRQWKALSKLSKGAKKAREGR
jgi:ribosome biogenesis GTPase / thiamine phosphate phosphatase